MTHDETTPPAAPRRRRWGRVVLGCFGTVVLAVALLGLGLYLTADSWVPAAGEHVQKWLADRQQSLGPNLPAVDEVEILALDGLKLSTAADSYPVGVGERSGVLARRTVRGEEAGRIAAHWRGQSFQREYSLCFDPHYALRFRHQGRLVFETAICWHCHGYTMRMGWLPPILMGFDAKSDEAQRLLTLLTELLPHPPEK